MSQTTGGSRGLETRDPIYGYNRLTPLEESILNQKIVQRLRQIRTPAGAFQVYPGADSSLLARMLGTMHITELLFRSLGANEDEVQRARLTVMISSVGRGAWSNVMREYLSGIGLDNRRMAEVALAQPEIREVLEHSTYSTSEIRESIRRGAPIRDMRVDLFTCPLNPDLIDMFQRDAYFAGVQYAQLEFRRLFGSTRIIKNRMAVERGVLFTLESYLSAATNMFDAIYYHKTVRAAELMLLRVLEEAGSLLLRSPADDPSTYFSTDDITLYGSLSRLPPDPPERLVNASNVFRDFHRRRLIKVASDRTIGNDEFLKKLETPDGRFELEREIAEEARLDPNLVYIDFPTRESVAFWPGRLAIDELMLFERGSRGYELWPVTDLSNVARSFMRRAMVIRIYAPEAHRAKIRKRADSILESVDSIGEVA
ncbi:MAG: hypothetical protein QXS20_03590 [Candidatus Thorarchaeota archaeon]